MTKMGHATNGQIWTVIPYRGKFQKFYNPIEAYQLFADHIVNLLTGEVVIFDFAKNWQSFVDSFQSGPGFSVLHLFYEFSSLTMRDLKPDSELGIVIRYGNRQQLDALPEGQDKFFFKKKSSPNFKSYAKKFEHVQNHLNKGNCYQINLTERYRFQFSDLKKISPMNIVSKVWNKSCGAYAHATYIQSQERLLLSNSPECLYQQEGLSVYSMPIKGTLALDESIPLEESWKELSSCSKNQAELDMITDLLRNDLSALEIPRAMVEKRKSALVVHKILHQYSKIKVELESQLPLSRFIQCLFPGGSITGAPKQRVCELIRKIEKTPRGFYCGSTILLANKVKSNFHVASINIRSADMNLKTGELVYGSGGGVTLKSRDTDEFNEMELKVNSFMDLFDSETKIESSIFE